MNVSGGRHYSGPKNWAAIARKRAGKKFRMYELYGDALKGGDITTLRDRYSRGSHRWIFSVRARDVREAASYAARCAFAQSPSTGGVVHAQFGSTLTIHSAPYLEAMH